MQPDEKIRRAVMQLRNGIRWHEDVIKEQERYGQSFEAVRHREVIRQLLDQIYALERDAT